MNKHNRKTMIAAMLLGALCAVTGCAGAKEQSAVSDSGTLLLKINPEIAVEYDDAGIVTEITARNEDAKPIVAACEELIGVDARIAIPQIVTEIAEAGYFVDDIDGTVQELVLEIEPGSVLPDQTFFDDLITDVRAYVDGASWYKTEKPLEKETSDKAGSENTEYKITDYHITDYGVTDYGTTDYGMTDYGVTDYIVTEAVPAAPASKPAAVTEQKSGKTDYGVTDYGTTDYGMTDYGVTDYGRTDYGESDYGKTDYHNGASDYDD